MLIDVHVHTKEKSPDAHSPIKKIIFQAINKNIDALILTDHNYCWFPEELADIETSFQNNIILWSGTELIFPECHLILLGTQPGYQPCFTSVKEAIHFIHDLNGCAIIAHPFSKTKRLSSLSILSLHPDGLEVFNGRRKQFEYRDVFIARSLDLAELGGSDEHDDPPVNIGISATFIPHNISSLKEFIENVKRKKTRAFRFFPI